MKPIRIFTHAICEPPAYLVALLDRLKYPYQQVCLYQDQRVPMSLDDISALVFMGGPGDVNDPTDWMRQELLLIEQAQSRGIPMLGICLGAQLLSKAMGGKVWLADSLEVGWHEVELSPAARQHPWFDGVAQQFTVFQWHAHNFLPPPGCEILASSACTPCQAYVAGNSLALQFHLEMDVDIINTLTETYGSDLVGDSNCVQGRAEIIQDMATRCERSFGIADHLLASWFRSIYSNKSEKIRGTVGLKSDS